VEGRRKNSAALHREEEIVQIILTHEDLKKIPVGTQLRLVQTEHGPCNLLRTVKAVHTHGLELEGEGLGPFSSWLYYPKRNEFRRLPDGFAIVSKKTRSSPTRRVLARYRYTGSAAVTKYVIVRRRMVSTEGHVPPAEVEVGCKVYDTEEEALAALRKKYPKAVLALASSREADVRVAKKIITVPVLQSPTGGKP
jgi:hypothetical protein